MSDDVIVFTDNATAGYWAMAPSSGYIASSTIRFSVNSPKTTAMANAVSALNRQRRPDGRPFTFQPLRTE